MIDDVRSILKNMRTNVDNEFQDWFKEAKQIANEVGADIKVPRYAHRQQHRANAPADTPLQYFKLNVGIPFLDHIDQEMSSRFCEENRPGRDLFLLVPSVVRKCTDLRSMNNKLQFWKDDIPIHLSLLNEIKEWKRHWTLQQPQEDPTTLFESYLVADKDRFPNIKALLNIGGTPPIGSADAERSFSCLRRLKTYLKNRMGEDRLSSLALMNIHHEFEVNTNKVIEEFKKKSNRQLFSISLLLD